jgi:putative endonuclease
MHSLSKSPPTNWAVYIILCSDNSLYTGITNDLQRRFKQHCKAQGAKYFRGRQPVKIVFAEGGHDRSSASKRECAIKRLSHAEKLSLSLSWP